jgi:hypothetical protein
VIDIHIEFGEWVQPKSWKRTNHSNRRAALHTTFPVLGGEFQKLESKIECRRRQLAETK